LDHPPQVEALVDELYETLSEPGRRGYEAMITGEYVPGALLHLGVGHAAQGGGEVPGTAIGCPMSSGSTQTSTRR
jgi:hypothetical protein